MMEIENDLIPISLLSQYYYCQRRAGLLLLEQQWQDNVHTAEGTVLHKHVHNISSESRDTLQILRSVTVRSLKIGLIGVVDCLEVHQSENGFTLPWLKGRWVMYPIEYKHGKKRHELEYEVQMTAQAMCLEHMYDCKIEKGFVYYGDDRRRVEIVLDDYYRNLVIQGVQGLNAILKSQITPIAKKSSKCRECSLNDVCFSNVLNKRMSTYLGKVLSQACGDD